LLFPRAEADIATTCLAYLSFDLFRKDYHMDYQECKSLVEMNPLLEYAVLHWGHHVRDEVEKVMEKVLEFLAKEHNVACASQLLLSHHVEYCEYSNKLNR